MEKSTIDQFHVDSPCFFSLLCLRSAIQRHAGPTAKGEAGESGAASDGGSESSQQFLGSIPKWRNFFRSRLVKTQSITSPLLGNIQPESKETNSHNGFGYKV